MKHILSRQNPEIKSVYSLRSAKARYQLGLFIAEGMRTCTTLIKSQTKLRTLYITEKHSDRLSSHIDREKICLVSPHVMEKISQSATPSGILGVFEMPPKPKSENLNYGIVLAQMSDPGNIGALIRTAAAMNIGSAVIIEGADPWNFKVIQASAGFINHVNIFQWSWHEIVKHATNNNLTLAALVVSGGQSPTTLHKKNTLLIVGNEANGIPNDWLVNCTTITLTMPGNIESLNAAIAGSIALYVAFAQ